MGDEIYDAIVVGAGPGGAACAGLLAKRGMKTLLLDKNDRPGGKTLTVSRGGFTYELWPVTANPVRNSQYEAVIGELGLEVELVPPSPESVTLYRGPSGEYAPYQLPGPVPLTQEESEEFGRFFADVTSMTPEQIDALDEVTFHEFISRYRIPQSLYSFFAMFANIAFLVPVDLVSASEAVKTWRDFMQGGATGYFKGGFGRLAEGCAEAVKRNGGDVRLRTRVERISIEDGQVRGVVTDQGAFHAPIVVSNAGIQPTVLKLVGEEHFDKGYVNYVKDLVPSMALIGTRYFLSKPVMEHPIYMTFSDDSYWNSERYLKAKAGWVPEEGFIHVVTPSVYDPSLAPAGKQCVLGSIMSPSDPEMKNTQAWWDKLDEMMAKLWPEFPQHIEHKEHYSAADVSAVARDHVLPGQGGECIGLAQVVGQCGRHKPSAKAPLRGLFYVGCDAGGYGCGTHQAVDSALKVAHIVLQYHQMHQVV